MSPLKHDHTVLFVENNQICYHGNAQRLYHLRRMRFTTQWRAVFRVKSFKADVVRREWLGVGEGEGGRGSGRRLEITGGGATSQRR